MRIPLATDLKTRTGAPDKDARLKNCYVESKGPMNDPNNPPETAIRKRPIAQGGVAVGTGIAQGGYGLVVVYGDTLYPIPTGTTCNNASTYSIGDHVTINYQDFWATTNHVGNCPIGGTGNSDWSTSFVPSIAITYAVLSNPSPAITLSGGNLIATINNAYVFGGCLSSNISKSSGKWYWEVTITSFSGFDLLSEYLDIGVSTSSLSASRWVGYQPTGYSYGMITQTSSSSKGHANVNASYGSALTQGDVIGVALDMDLGTLTFYRNGVSQGIAYSGLAGTVYAAIGGIAKSADTTNIVLTANFGASAFIYSPPVGFNSGLYI